MITQYYTSTRPDTTAPFWAESIEGKSRSDAVFQLMDQHPELVISYHKPEFDGSSLSAQAVVNFNDVDSFRSFMDLVTALDPNLRKDRAEYVKKNNHTLLIEYHMEGMEERGLIANIMPDQSIIQQRDGSVTVIPTAQNI